VNTATYTRRLAPVVLIADDDPDDRELTADALSASASGGEVRCVEDGQELLDYLRREGQYESDAAPRPDVILLDLNMPKRTGAEALADIKADDQLRTIPIVVLSTSSRTEDVRSSYDLGASSYVVKPSSFTGLVEAMRAFERYWFDLVDLPLPALQ
jgi:CheY-like chemotaxis protein